MYNCIYTIIHVYVQLNMYIIFMYNVYLHTCIIVYVQYILYICIPYMDIIYYTHVHV